MTIRSDFYTPRVRQPPSSVTDPALFRFLQDLVEAINTLPTLSTFSYSSPNSNESGIVGTLASNVADTAPRLWVKYQGSSNTGWWPLASLRTAASLDSTTLLVNDAALSLHASGASLAIRSGGTIWYFTSSMSTKG